ncbi:MAG TPA: O-antigen ligase family protein [Vicinamibacterales bacterium]|jgi:O-antigen ligase|nr:O-antigen ligase family protein [Vicinamibacterales bacterium]
MATTVFRGHMSTGDWYQRIGFSTLVLFVAALQFSIAVAQIFLSVALLMWGLRLATRRSRFEAPDFFVPLLAYAGITLVSAAFSSDRLAGFIDSKQLVLFLIVPMVYEFARGVKAPLIVQVIISVGAISAAIGVIQYGILEYNNLGRRAHGSLGHYMTYSGLLMLVTCAAVARILFTRERVWPLLMMPALLVALAATFSRSAWVGTCAGVTFLLFLKDFRLMAVLPMAAALFLTLGPPRITDRFYSMFDPHDVTRLDRVAMLHVGERMVAAYPLTGVGPTMVQRRYREFLSPDEDQHVNPHLHNVPVQIAAERGLPALAIWIWFIVALVIGLIRHLREPAENDRRFLAAGALAAIIAMLAAGQFEYNFGDSEFLMLFLVMITLPYAAEVHADS